MNVAIEGDLTLGKMSRKKDAGEKKVCGETIMNQSY